MSGTGGPPQALVVPLLSGESARVRTGLVGAFLVGVAFATGCVNTVDLIGAPDAGAGAGAEDDGGAGAKADASDPKLVDAGADSAK